MAAVVDPPNPFSAKTASAASRIIRSFSARIDILMRGLFTKRPHGCGGRRRLNGMNRRRRSLLLLSSASDGEAVSAEPAALDGAVIIGALDKIAAFDHLVKFIIALRAFRGEPAGCQTCRMCASTGKGSGMRSWKWPRSAARRRAAASA